MRRQEKRSQEVWSQEERSQETPCDRRRRHAIAGGAIAGNAMQSQEEPSAMPLQEERSQ